MDNDTLMKGWDDPANPFNPGKWSSDHSPAPHFTMEQLTGSLHLYEETQTTQDTPVSQEPIGEGTGSEITMPSAADNYEPKEEPSSPVAEQDTFIGEYHLSESTRDANRGFASTWVDHDETADFNPAEEARKARQWKRRSRPAHRGDEANGDIQTSDDADDGTGDDADAATGMRPIVLIKLTSEAGKAVFSELCLRQESKLEPPRDDFSTRYRLRARKGPAEPTAANLSHGEKALVGLPPNLTGHPDARGCWDCHRLGLHCSLLDNECHYSCKACKEDGNDCRLITEPVRKMSCTYCLHLQQKDKSSVCSLNYEDDHSGPCKRCVRDGHFPCIAGPRLDAIVARRRIDNDCRPFINEEDWDYTPTHESSCRQCQDSERACSFVDDNIGDLCTACEMFGLDCSPILSLRHKAEPSAKSAPSRKKAKSMTRKAVRKAQRESATTTVLEPSGSSDLEMDFTDITGSFDPKPTSRPAVRTVKTYFSHPMEFDVEKGCHFFKDPKLFFFGLGERMVDVVELENGRGWQEVSGGHRAESLEYTRVCSNARLLA